MLSMSLRYHTTPFPPFLLHGLTTNRVLSHVTSPVVNVLVRVLFPSSHSLQVPKSYLHSKKEGRLIE